MKQINQKLLTGERVLFQGKDLKIHDTIFADGESPLKESRNIELYRSMFEWKYPLWYGHNIKTEDCVLLEMGCTGTQYTESISMKNCIAGAPKNSRRATGIELERVTISNASETLWNRYQIRIDQISAKGDHLAINSSNLYIDGLELVGNYSLDGVKNAETHYTRLLSRDAFWNSESATAYDSFTSGEYLGWSARSLALINRTIESSQGMCYIDNLVMKNCYLLNAMPALEYFTVDVEVNNTTDNVLNPNNGVIRTGKIEGLVMDASKTNVTKTLIQTEELGKAVQNILQF